MRSAPLLALICALSLAVCILIACGGGGSSSTPATSPNNPAAPTSAPSGSPGAGATPGASPTPSSQTIGIGDGETNGSPQPLLVSTANNTNGYTGGGDLEPGNPGATSSGGGQGPLNGGAVDGVTCVGSMSNDYHVHIFVGIMYNGQEVAVPAGLGMDDPYPPDQTVSTATGDVVPSGSPDSVPNQSDTATCYYDMHTHDNSGMVHVETSLNNPQLCGEGNNYATECNYKAPFTLQTFFDIWGISVTANNFGPLTGPVTVYTTPEGYNSYAACGSSGNYVDVPCETYSTSYQISTLSQAESMPLYSHSTFWFVVGSQGAYTTASSLPNINWVEGDP